jgi:hypothetical protein
LWGADRYLSFFTDGRKIIVTNGFLKKTDRLPESEKELAIKLREDYFKRKWKGVMATQTADDDVLLKEKLALNSGI